MAYPDLYSDETIVLNAQNIKVKSVSFEAVLTTRRLILVDSKKHLIAPQEILLATLRDIEVGENAIRDPTITLSIITNTGATRQMILTFSKTSGGERKRECDEWVKHLRQQITSGGQHPIMPDVQSRNESPTGEADTQPPSLKIEAANIPVAPSPKKKIEIARPGPIKKIVETAPSMPKPVETTTLPTGSFCNRCGSRVPPESAFCNKCGTPVVTESDLEARLTGTADAPASSVPQVQMHSPPVFGGGTDKKEHTIEEVIHTIEPLIEDSVPRTVPAPLIPKQHPSPSPEPTVTPPLQEPEAPAMPEVKWPVIDPGASPAPGETPPAGPSSPPSLPPVPRRPSRVKKSLVIGVIAVVIIAVVAAVFIFANPLGGNDVLPEVTPEVTPDVTPEVIPTPEVTTIETVMPTSVPETAAIPETTASAETPQVLIPNQGVWVHVLYTGAFKGSLGTPGNQMDVSDKGDKYYQIPTSEGIVAVSLQKLDGSSDKLTVEVYKNGELVTRKSTVTPKGVVEVLANLKPSPTPTPTPTPTKAPIPAGTTSPQSENTTANATTTSAP